MFKILNKQAIAPGIKRLDIQAEEIARRISPGQFVMVTPHERAESIPLAVIDHDLIRGTIALIFQEAGPSLKDLGEIAIKEDIYSIVGPLGVPAKIEKCGTVVCIATGMGAAQILPICRAHKKAGNKVIGIIGAKTKRALVLEAQMRLCCNKLLIATNDGSYIKRGLATDLLEEVLVQEKPNLVCAIGSVEMMETAARMTKEKNVKLVVSVRPVMIDGTGVCGSCRVTVGGQAVLACVEGPEFDGHQVDYQDLGIRMNAYELIEKEFNEWRSPRLTPSRKNGEPATLTKFLSGILRNRP